MAYNQTVNFTPYDEQMAEIQRRQRMAELMQQQAIAPLETPQSGGRMIARVSPLAGLAKMLQAYAAGKEFRDIEKQRGAAEETARTQAMDWLKGFQPSVGVSPDAALQAATTPIVRPNDVAANRGINYAMGQSEAALGLEPGTLGRGSEEATVPVTTPAPQQQVTALSPTERQNRLYQGALSANPYTAKLASVLMAQKQPNEMDYVNKIDVDKFTPQSVAAYLAPVRQGGLPNINALQLKPEKAEKAPALSEVGRLISERDKLPENDPRRRIYDNAIAKASTREPRQDAGVAPMAGLDQDTIKNAAVVVAADPARLRDYAPIGKAGQEARAAIQNEITRNLKDAGLTAQDLVTFRVSAKNNAASAANLQKQANAVEAFEGLAKNNGQRILDLIQTLDAGGIPATEKLIRGAARRFGNADAAELKSVLTTFRTEVSRILSNPNMSGVVSDSARNEIAEMAPDDMTIAQAKRVIGRLFTEMDVRKHYTEQALQGAYGRMNIIPGQRTSITQSQNTEPSFNVNKNNNTDVKKLADEILAR